MSSILAEILAAKRRRLAAGEPAPRGPVPRSSGGERVAAALRSGAGPAVIAEVKHRSPSAGVLLPDAEVRIEEIARAYRRGGAAALSVVVEQDFFGGDPAWLPRAKAAAGLPVLMKDFVVDPLQLDLAVSLGADAVLLIVAALSAADLARLHSAARERGLAVVVEAHDAEEVRRALRVSPEIVGVNARNLASFAVDIGAVEALGRAIPGGTLRVAESGVKTAAAVSRLGAAGYGAFLVGETLLRASDPAAALRTLRGVNPTEVKICGVTREEDVESCLASRVDWIGLVFAAGSPRRLTEERGTVLRMKAKGEAGERPGGGGSAGSTPGAIKGVVAVFDTETPNAEVERVVDVVRPDAVQMPLGPRFPSKKPFSPDIEVWNTVRVGRDDLAGLENLPGDILHFDSSSAGLSGGTGKTFDWSLLDAVPRSRPVVLAGGLTPANVGAAVKRVKPDVVDVASGVESAPGIKDAELIASFVAEVRRA
jgi:indole-3-glycerol phosphate synthase